MSDQEQQPPATAQQESTDVSRARVAIELTDILLKTYLDILKSGEATSQDRATAAMLLKTCGTLPKAEDLRKAKGGRDALDDIMDEKKEGKQ